MNASTTYLSTCMPIPVTTALTYSYYVLLITNYIGYIRTLRFWFFTVGGISISGGVTFNPSQLTLTCISTGGPATTVTWTRDNVNITGEQNETVLNDPVTAQYTHTLTVTTAGEYTCTVANNKPSSDSANTFVTGKMSTNHYFGMQAKNQRTLEECNTFLASEANGCNILRALQYVSLHSDRLALLTNYVKCGHTCTFNSQC